MAEPLVQEQPDSLIIRKCRKPFKAGRRAQAHRIHALVGIKPKMQIRAKGAQSS